MLSITNQKIAGMKPVWAPFRGVSLLFDNPGNSIQPLGSYDLLEVICCRPSDPELAFYHNLNKAGLDQFIKTYFFCPLPFHSYHVTVWDGLNNGNLNKIARPDRFDAEDMLANLHETFSASERNRFLCTEQGVSLDLPMEGPITFAFKEVEKRGNSAVVVNLKPADPISEQRLKQVEQQRTMLIEEYKRRYGLYTTSTAFRPHVSIGYFANKEYAELSDAAIARLNETLAKSTQGLTVTFASMSLYGMSDMETFFRPVKR
ncbi:hypothetical protein GC093_25255 [Paenibacillus sp. LMG 31456]|uniref:DUF1868 domain-containing protein n=1 Tax=Paenibacillus foliorum TaxID=2654974 RepID=A0A972GUP2_9BACL|nr:hypothetical protein [Paenibacillus foliorum]NOU96500.1 hypothetical protein [Paenibacillus foliorum]